MRPVVVQRYKTCILEEHKYLPPKIQPLVATFHETNEFTRLVTYLAEWLTLMEMSNDLIDRLQEYGIT
jgi:hypothetical protein